MKFRELSLPGVWLVDAEPVADDRGLFRRHFCAREFAAHGLAPTVAQGNISENPKRHTLRGFHFQAPPHAEAKTLSCLTGALHDVILDLRPASRTYMKWIAVELDALTGTSLYVPPGCANAYLTLEDRTVVHYYMSEFFAPESYLGLRFNDPAFGVRWPAEPAVISDRDRSFPDFDGSSHQNAKPG